MYVRPFWQQWHGLGFLEDGGTHLGHGYNSGRILLGWQSSAADRLWGEWEKGWGFSSHCIYKTPRPKKENRERETILCDGQEQTECFTREQYTLALWHLPSPLLTLFSKYAQATKRENTKRVSESSIFGFCCYFVGFLLAGIRVPQLRQQTQTLRYQCPKRMPMEWSVPRASIQKVSQSDKPDSWGPWTQLGPRPWWVLLAPRLQLQVCPMDRKKHPWEWN